jgi:hypothetical protein
MKKYLKMMSYRSTFVNELLDTGPVVSRSKVLSSDRYAIFCSASYREVMFGAKKPPHFKEEIEQNPRLVTIRAGMTSLYLIGPCSFD